MTSNNQKPLPRQNNKAAEILHPFEDNLQYRQESPFAAQERYLFHKERPWQRAINENTLFTLKEVQVKRQVEEILAELARLAQATQNLAKEVKTAVETPPVVAGVYHLSFLQKIRETIVLFRQKVEQSTTWLSLFNQRNQKQGYYWGQFKKSGQKFMLSQERYSATQVG